MSLERSNYLVPITYEGKNYMAHPILSDGVAVAHLFQMSTGAWCLKVIPGHQWGHGNYEGIVLMTHHSHWRDKIRVSPKNPHRITVEPAERAAW